MRRLRLSLAVHRALADGRRFVSGFLVAPEPDIPPVPLFGELIGLEVTPKRSGRPRDVARRVAVALACDVEEKRQGGRNRADAEVARLLGYADARVVRAVRAKPIPGGIQFVMVGDDPAADVGVLAERIHRLTTTDEAASLDCAGWAWRRERPARAVFGRIRMAIAMSSWAPGARERLARFAASLQGSKLSAEI